MGFNLVNLLITVRSDDMQRLRCCLPSLGKDYAVACRSLLCLRLQHECGTCSLQETCGWHLVFGQKLSSDPTALKRYQKPPLPFVFSFYGDNSPDSTDECACGLVVIGPAISHIEMLLEGFSDLIETRFSAEIVRISCRDYQGTVLYQQSGSGRGSLSPENLVVASTEGLLESRSLSCSQLCLRLLSPLRLVENGHAVTRFDFSRFARSVMRRVSSMSYYYGESEFDCDFRELTRQVEDVICIDDHFIYTNTAGRNRRGIHGYGSFVGDLHGLMPFLVIGSYIHGGKSSAFGMGAYELILK